MEFSNIQLSKNLKIIYSIYEFVLQELKLIDNLTPRYYVCGP